jgi:hypothetical protein
VAGVTGGDTARARTHPGGDTGQELLDFAHEHRHFNVPQKYADNPTLGAWVAQKRRCYKQGNLSAQRISSIEQAGIEVEWRRTSMCVCVCVCVCMHASRVKVLERDRERERENPLIK